MFLREATSNISCLFVWKPQFEGLSFIPCINVFFKLIIMESFIFHRLPALEGNPEHVLTNNPFIIDALAAIGNEATSDINQDTFNIKKEYLAFTFFDSIVSPFLPKIDTKIAKQLVDLRTKRENELLALRKHIRDVVTKLLNDSKDNAINENNIEDCLFSLQTSVSDVLEINQQAWKKYSQSLLEDKAIWVGIAGLVATLAGGISPIIPASFGVEMLAAMGARAMKTLRQRRELLNASPTRFLYYLDRTLGKQ